MTSYSFLSTSLATPQMGEKTTQRADLLTDNQRQIFELVNCVFISSIVGLFGIVANTINIIVFFRQGFTTTVNISLFALAISDLCGLLTLEWHGLCVNPLFVSSPVPIVAREVRRLTAALPHLYFVRTTSWITAFVTAERCFCILFPLKVKQLITPRRVAIVIVCICLLNLLPLVPQYVTNYISWKFYPGRNQTLLGVIFTENGQQLVRVSFVLSAVLTMTSFVAVILLTVLLVVKLKQQAQWRSKSAGRDKQRNSTSSRDRQTMSMVAVIAAVLIGCGTPVIALGLLNVAIPEIRVKGIYSNVFLAIFSFPFVFQSINSSINIFFFYKMSSKYRQEFHRLFSACSRT